MANFKYVGLAGLFACCGYSESINAQVPARVWGVTIESAGLLGTFSGIPIDNVQKVEIGDRSVSVDFETVGSSSRTLAGIRVLKLASDTLAYTNSLQSVREQMFRDDVHADCAGSVSFSRSFGSPNPAAGGARPTRIEARCTKPKFGRWKSSFGIFESINNKDVRCEWVLRQEALVPGKPSSVQMQDICSSGTDSKSAKASIRVFELTSE